MSSSGWFRLIGNPIRHAGPRGGPQRTLMSHSGCCFNRFGYYMGAAFQIHDDVLNLIGDRAKYGKEIGGDILEGKRTLILIHMLQQCSAAERKRMRRFLRTPREDRRSDEVDRVYRLMDKYGSIDYARTSARNLAGAALSEFPIAYGALPDSEDKTFVHDIILYMIEREL